MTPSGDRTLIEDNNRRVGCWSKPCLSGQRKRVRRRCAGEHGRDVEVAASAVGPLAGYTATRR